jgi:hypothetical protein
MKYRINCNEDAIEIEAETMEEIRTIAFQETTRRGWKQDDCWSERIES